MNIFDLLWNLGQQRRISTTGRKPVRLGLNGHPNLTYPIRFASPHNFSRP